MTTFNIINELNLKDKRALLSELKESIKSDVLMQKTTKLIIKQNKEAEKKAKVLKQIKMAEDKLAKLNARLSA
jgi:formylmethanofuran:tetrahydromethanopterin formyltransferase